MGATINGRPILRCELREPRVGAWTAEIDADADAKLSGPVVIEIDAETWVGTVVRGDVFAGRSHASVVGGAGGLSRILEAKHYVNGTMAAVLADIMSGAGGEAVSPLSDTSVTTALVSRWSRSKGTIGAAIKQIADHAGCSWRVLRNGTVWIGSELWLPAVVKADEVNRTPNRGTISIAPEKPTVKPGDTFDGHKVSRVTTSIVDGDLRQELLIEDGAVGGFDRMMQSIAALVDHLVGRRIDYAQMYPCRVIAQNLDGTLELYPDNKKIRGSGLSKVGMKHGIPGVTVLVLPGARVNLFFEDEDPLKPAAALWPDGSSVTKITIDGDLEVTGEIYACSGNPLTKVALSTHLHPTAMGPSGSPTGGT